MPAVRSLEGTHAKGSCEPGQGGRCSHKQRPLVQWISLSGPPAAGSIFFVGAARQAEPTQGKRNRRQAGTEAGSLFGGRPPGHRMHRKYWLRSSPLIFLVPWSMAKKSVSAPELASPSVAKQAYTVLARRYRPQQFADLVGQEAVVRALVN